MLSIDPQRLEQFFARFPRLEYVLDTLAQLNVPYAIGGSGCLFVLGNDRLPDDVDVYIPAIDHDRVDRAFEIESFPYRSALEEVRNSNPEQNHDLQLTSGLMITAEGKVYDLELSENVLSMRLCAEYHGRTVYFYPPESVLLIKALLQRGADVGKHDVEDIQNFLVRCPYIRWDFLQECVDALGAHDRVGSIFQRETL